MGEMKIVTIARRNARKDHQLKNSNSHYYAMDFERRVRWEFEANLNIFALLLLRLCFRVKELVLLLFVHWASSDSIYGLMIGCWVSMPSPLNTVVIKPGRIALGGTI